MNTSDHDLKRDNRWSEYFANRVEYSDEEQYVYVNAERNYPLANLMGLWAELGYIDIIKVSQHKTTNGNPIYSTKIYTFVLTEYGKMVWTIHNL